MRSLAFSKFSPSGNTTLFLHARAPANPRLRAALCRQALGHEGIDAEQAGFADIAASSLVMAAGEFCVNACRAFGALLDCQQPRPANVQRGSRKYQMKVSGCPSPVELLVDGQLPIWSVSASFHPEGISFSGSLQNGLVANLPGIMHLLLRRENFPAALDAADLACEMRRQYGLEGAPAAGIVWWRQAGDNLEIWPYVHVRDADTSMLESACGSATLALAIALASENGASICEIRQPCGQILSASVAPNSITIGGHVALTAQGKLWLAEKCKPAVAGNTDCPE